MTARPLRTAKIQDLEAEFRTRLTDHAFLGQLAAELAHRSARSAARLRGEVEQLLAGLAADAPTSWLLPADRRTGTVPPVPKGDSPPAAAARLLRSEVRAAQPMDNAPGAILSAWTALEVLSPQSFVRPEDLAGGSPGEAGRAVARFDRGLPWEGAGEKSKPGYQIYYQLVLGSVDLPPAFGRLVELYGDARPERPASRGEAALAVVMLDRTGRPVEDAAVSVSSFGWGLARALQNRLEALGDWQAVEEFLREQLDARLRRHDAEGQLLPLDAPIMEAAFEWLVGKLELPDALVKPPAFAIRTYQPFREPEPPQGLLLNSFYLADLAAARARFEAGDGPANLRRFLGVLPPRERRDLLNDRAALADAVSPARFPPARWPGPGRHPLVLLQQAAVNLALGESSDGGILAVNGPPGTGKTTLLRDVVAGLVTERARAMAGFDDPGEAFRHSGEKLKAGNAWLHLYALDPKLCGFEMLVASSNNKAVENVSAELPSLGSIAEDAPNLRYFKTLSDTLRDAESWGLVAAVLGNAGNRSRFRQAFWWDDDRGLRRYLAAATGAPQVVEETDPATGETRRRPPRIVEAEEAPRDRDEALRRWKAARKTFRHALRRSEAMLRETEEVRRLVERLPALARTLAEAEHEMSRRLAAVSEAMLAVADAERGLAEGKAALQEARVAHDRHGRERPGFLARLFRTARARSWSATEREGQDIVRRAGEVTAARSANVAVARREVEAAEEATSSALGRQLDAQKALSAAERRVEAVRDRVGLGVIDEQHFAHDHAERHVAAPWLDDAMHRLRDAVFVTAVALHKAFLDAAAKPMRHNLGALMQVFSGGTLRDEKRALLPDLWRSLFLVTPVVSTTFASVGRMLADLPDEALGWLLIDEAGQAVPQAAVGALMRTRRAVVVGDPLQVEPVVTLPEALTEAICRRFGVDPDRFNAPVASVQTLADAATPFMAEFPGREGSRAVGVPLLVHRRCAEPMFGISNAVAYEHLMVQAKAVKPSTIAAVLGPSAWIDVRGGAEEKWCPEEGQAVVALLRRLRDAGTTPDLYVVTPFKVVQDRLRSVIRSSGVLDRWTTDPGSWVKEQIGTVHTVQGREAEAVIFVLGAPDAGQSGARGWAGKRPNLLNVAVTRAKEVVYVIGNRQLWRGAGVFQTLDVRLAASTE